MVKSKKIRSFAGRLVAVFVIICLTFCDIIVEHELKVLYCPSFCQGSAFEEVSKNGFLNIISIASTITSEQGINSLIRYAIVTQD